MRRNIRSMEYVQGDRHAAAAPASDGFPDFGSLDGLEAAIGRAELAAADPGRDRGRQRAINHGLLPASSARGLQFMASRPAHQSARGPGVMAANAAAQPSSRRTVDSLAELARVQQRHTRKLKNILQLLKPKRDNPMDAASNSPFDFLP